MIQLVGVMNSGKVAMREMECNISISPSFSFALQLDEAYYIW